MSIHDELTGLYNRSYCSEFMKNLDIKEHPIGMIYLDMDNFKLYNDLYGEETGDQILKWSASQVQNLCSDKMSVFRVGSNEFLIIAEESRKEILLSFARLIQNTILEQKEDKPKVIQPITFSIGIAWDKTWQKVQENYSVRQDGQPSMQKEMEKTISRFTRRVLRGRNRAGRKVMSR